MPLPLHYLFVAGLGRRVIGPREEVRAELVKTLKHIAAAASDAQPVAMASGAAGADQVFLEAAESLGWPLRLVLPVPVYLFEKDFTSTKTVDGKTVSEVDEPALATFRRLKAVAVEVEVIPPSPSRREAFTRCGNQLVSQADVVVALWDRQPGKQGGTNESLLVANQLAVPLVTLDALSGRPLAEQPVPAPTLLASRHTARHAEGTILHDIDEAIRRNLSPTQWAAFATSTENEQHAQYGSLLSGQAEKLAHSYKRKNLHAILWHAGASFVGLLALLFFIDVHTVGYVATVIKVAAVAIAFWLAHTAKSSGGHNKWVKARFVREVNRSLGATAEVARQTGDAHDAFVPTSIWVLFRHLHRPLLLFHGLFIRQAAPMDLLQTLRCYRERRLRHDPDFASKPLDKLSQHDYQLWTGNQANHRHHKIERIFKCTTVSFFVCGAALLIPAFHEFDVLYRLAKWLTVLLPVLSAALLVLPNLWDIHRRRRVAPALARTLARLDGEAAQIEVILADLAHGKRQTVTTAGIPVWAGTEAQQRAFIEAWARTRIAAIAREAEDAILTEVIGFKTFVENAEVG